MRRFIVIGHKARTAPDFTLNDLPGAGGRMDVLARCVNSAFFLSHSLREDSQAYLVLKGEPNPPKTIRFDGKNLKYLSPDERSAGSLIKKALDLQATTWWRESTPGVWIRQGGLQDLLDELECDLVLLDEDGDDIRSDCPPESACWVLSDHLDLTQEEVEVLGDARRVSVGPKILHADHCIILVQNELDRCYNG